MATRDVALERLSGLNLMKILDSDGSGMIDAVVLERSLKRFDDTVFTEKNIKDLLASVGAAPEGGGLVRISKLHDDVATATAAAQLAKPPMTPKLPKAHSAFSATPSTPGLNRLLSTESHCECLDQYMDSLIGDIKGFREVMEPELLANVATCSKKELESIKESLRLRAKEHMVEAQRKNIRPIWDEFDRDKNGVLSVPECAKLVKAYLRAMAPKAPDIIRGSIELGIELSVLMFEARVIDPMERKKMREHAQVQVETIHAKILPIVLEAVEHMQSENPEEIARELCHDLENSAGQVTRDEFEGRFVEAMQHVLGPERMMEKLPKVNAA